MGIKELCIGNFVNYLDKDYVVYNISENGIIMLRLKGGISYTMADINKIKPIPLTKEWVIELTGNDCEDEQSVKNEIDLFDNVHTYQNILAISNR